MKKSLFRPGTIIITFSVLIAAVACVTASALARGHGHGHMPPGLEKKMPHDSEVQPVSGSDDAWIQPVPSPEQDEKWKDNRPPGWSHGKKTGWGDSDMPPGLSKNKDHHDNDENNDELMIPGQHPKEHESKDDHHKHKKKHGKGHKNKK